MQSNRQKGAINKRNGATFEKIIQTACKAYTFKGVAFIEKTPEPFHIVKRDKMVHGFYEKTAQPDFKGVLKGGRCIVFEAKHTNTDRIKQDVVTPTQWQSLDMYERFDAECFVLVSIKFRHFYKVPWNIWKQMKELFGHKYMNEEELMPYILKEEGQLPLFLE